MTVRSFNLTKEECRLIDSFLTAVEKFNDLIIEKNFVVLNEEEILIGSEYVQNKVIYAHIQKLSSLTGYTFDSPIESELTISVRNILSPTRQPRFFGFRIENSTFNGLKKHITNDSLGDKLNNEFESIFDEFYTNDSDKFSFLKTFIKDSNS